MTRYIITAGGLAVAGPLRPGLIDAERFGPWALITGASSGIGKEFAQQIAAHGIHVARWLSAVALKLNPGLKTTLDDLTTVYRRGDAVR